MLTESRFSKHVGQAKTLPYTLGPEEATIASQPIEILLPPDIFKGIRAELTTTPRELRLSADSVQFLMVPLRYRWNGEATDIVLRELPADMLSEEMTSIVKELYLAQEEGEHVKISDEDLAEIRGRFGDTTSIEYWRAVLTVVRRNMDGPESS